MKQHIKLFFALITILFLPQLECLNRDINYPCCNCYYHTFYDDYNDERDSNLSELLSSIPISLLQLIPSNYICAIGGCNNKQNYLGYTDPDLKYRHHLKRHLEYYSLHQDCHCYWPEYSLEAHQISDTAYLLFMDLISTTALSNLVDDENEQRKFINTSVCLNKHEVVVSFIVHEFRFSDYYLVCRDIENYAIANYEEKEVAKIKDKLDDVLEVLYTKFFALYYSCYIKHPSPVIDQEIRFMKLLVNDISGFEKTVISSNVELSLPTAQNSFDVSEFIVSNLHTSHIPVELKNKIIARKKHSIHTAPIDLSNAIHSVNVHSAPLSSDATKAFANVLSPQSEIFLEQGTVLNNFLFYKAAIEVLTQAIQLNPSNRDAYIERAVAYFETDQLPLALKDYESAKKLTITPPFNPGSHKAMMMRAVVYIPENKTEFSKGLVSGTIDGAKVSAVEFVPSIFSCCRGILNGLWAFVCTPVDVSQDMVNTAYAIGEFISNHSTEDCFQCVVPELKELSLSWDKLNDQSRGQKIGFIIGKYGVDIFAPVGILKGISKVRALKRANTMCTLESCASSQLKQSKILEESIKRASIRENIISESIKKGKILVRNSNTQAHIVQPKHTWDKLVKMSGNVEEDCKKVVKLLEDNQIFLEKYRLKTTETFEKFVRYNHQMEINGHEVKAIFNKNLESGEMFLNDAWVITK